MIKMKGAEKKEENVAVIYLDTEGMFPVAPPLPPSLLSIHV